MNRNARLKSLSILVIALAISVPVAAQSGHASDASRAGILATLSEVPPATLALFAEGARFSVTALRPVGHSVQVVIAAGIDSASFTIELAAEAVATMGLAVGTVVSATAVSAGYLLSVGSVAIAFVPSAVAAELIHHRELHR